MKKFCIFLSLISIGVHAQNQITTAEQLQAVNENLSGSYILMNDIDLSDYTDFIPIGGETGSFTGTFDGNGHSIKISSDRFKYSYSGYYDLGLFTVIGNGGLVKNLKITGYVSNHGYHKERLGGIAGTNKGTITNCSVGAQISINTTGGSTDYDTWNGGIAGINEGTITYCVVTNAVVTFKLQSRTGGIVGETKSGSKIENCVAMDKPYRASDGSSNNKCGWICGLGDNVTSTVKDCYYAAYSGSDLTGFGYNSGNNAVSDGIYCKSLSSWAIHGLTLPNRVYYNNSNTVFIDGIMSGSQVYEFAFTETDGKELFQYIIDNSGSACPTFKRAFTKDVKSTICLPFSADFSSFGKVYQFKGIKAGTTDVVEMEEVPYNHIWADKAYVFIPNATNTAEEGLIISEGSSVPVSSSLEPSYDTSSEFQFIGTYDEKVWNTGDSDLGQVYGFAISGYESEGFTAGQFVKLGAGASAAPFRAYLKYTGGSLSGASARTRGIGTLPDVLTIEWVSSNGATTGINNIEISPKDEWYNIMGHKLNYRPVTKGIYIHNGKKVIIR